MERKIAFEVAKAICLGNYDFFEENFEELYQKYPQKYISIKVGRVIGAYDTFEEAIRESLKEHELGTFLVQHCVRREEPCAKKPCKSCK